MQVLTIFRKKYFYRVIAIVLVLGVAYWKFFLAAGNSTNANGKFNSQSSAGAGAGAEPRRGEKGTKNSFNPPIAVSAEIATQGALLQVENSIGTVTAAAEVVVHSRVAGQLIKVLFDEGQWVHKGQLLAQIDPRSFEAALEQIQGQADRNKALLRNAEQDLTRYLSLQSQSVISQQQIDSQKALVEQYRGAVLADQGALANAKLQLSFTQITAPIDGRIGLRNIDAGNNISPNDLLGLAVITQVQPINLVFSVPEDSLPTLLSSQALAQTKKSFLSVEAWDKSNRQVLAKGQVVSIDNRIDPATGTLKIKARFSNQDLTLYPNQFVNVRLNFGATENLILIPVTAIQRAAQGTFVYVVEQNEVSSIGTSINSASINSDSSEKNAKRVATRPVKLGLTESNQVAVEQGLSAGEWVVTQGVDKLREGSLVLVNPLVSTAKENHSGRKSRSKL